MSSRPREDLTGYILGDFKGSVDAKGLLRTIFGRRVEGVGVTRGPATGWKAAEIARVWVMGPGGTKDRAPSKGRVSA